MAKHTHNEPKHRLLHASIAPHQLHFFCRPEGGFNHGAAHIANRYNLEDNGHDGKISRKAAKRIELALSWLFYLAAPKRIHDQESGKAFTFKVNFITLTLPATQVHSDEVIKSTALANFLRAFKHSHKLERYLWRAEAQANGNIHFHLVTDVYIHHAKIREVWNRCLQPLGYIDAFKLKCGHSNPNSTDVHSVKHVKKLASYLSKYMAKQRKFAAIGELRQIGKDTVEVLYGSKQYREESANSKKGKVIGHVVSGPLRGITGKLWFCSRELSKCGKLTIDQTHHEFTTLEQVIQDASLRKYSGEHVTSYFGNVIDSVEKFSPNIYFQMLPVAN